jgi:hypothetical protein
MKRFLTTLFFVAWLATSGQMSQKPNILFIFSDDLSFRDLSAYGQTNYKTPNFEALVAVYF